MLGYSFSEEGFVGCIVPDVEYLGQDGVEQELVFPFVGIPSERDDSVFESVKVYVVVQVKSEYVRNFVSHADLPARHHRDHRRRTVRTLSYMSSDGTAGGGGDEFGYSFFEEGFVGCLIPDAVEFGEDQVDQVSLSLVLWVEREREETVFERVEVYAVV